MRFYVVAWHDFLTKDLRVDKRYFFNRWNLNWYFDVQNAYNFQAEQPPVLVPVRDTDGSIKIDPNDPTRYKMRLIEIPAGTILPTIGGIIVAFKSKKPPRKSKAVFRS